jgi:hypothetical protein
MGLIRNVPSPPGNQYEWRTGSASCRGLFFHPASHGIAIHTRHCEIAHNQVDMLVAMDLQALRAPGSRKDGVPLFFQRAPENRPYGLEIIDDENGQPRLAASLFPAPPPASSRGPN